MIDSMLRLLFFIIFSLFLFGAPNEAEAQCISFAKSVCKSKLGSFVHDGNYNAVNMSEGESAELIKTFFSGQRYRIVFCKVDQLPKIRFWVTDSKGRVLFDNSTQNYTDTWDFESEKTQMLCVNFMVMEHASSKSNSIVSGCVAVLFGIEDN